MVNFFIDTANIDAIKNIWDKIKDNVDPTLLEGITTNPNAFKKIDMFRLKEWENHLPKLCELVTEMKQDPYGVVYVQAPVSTMSPDEVLKFAEHIVKFDDGYTHLGLKIPPFQPILNIIDKIEEFMPVNVTGVSDAGTALFALSFDPAFISVIPGRMEEVGINAYEHVRYLMNANYWFDSRVISGSMRTVEGLKWVSELGTVPTIGEKVWDLIFNDLSVLDTIKCNPHQVPNVFAPHNDQKNTDLSAAFFKQMDEYGDLAYKDFSK